MPLVDVFIPIY